MNDTTNALHILTISLSLSLFAAVTAVAPRATLLDALPILAAVVGVGLHRTGRLDDEPEEIEADGVDPDRPDRGDDPNGASDEQVNQAVERTTTITDGGER